MSKAKAKSVNIFEDTVPTESVVFDDPKGLTGLTETPTTSMDRTDPGWHEYVMSFFSVDELVNDMPKVAGLRRVSELIYGPPKFSGPIQVFPSLESDSPGRATVLFSVQFDHGTYQDVADSWTGNTDDAFAVYGVAMASTRAEARALRKALGLHGAAFEEITSKDTASIVRESTVKSAASKQTTGETLEGLASTRQTNFITALVERAKIDLDKLFQEMNIPQGKSITKQNATEIIDLLNCYINGSVTIPDNIRRS